MGVAKERGIVSAHVMAAAPECAYKMAVTTKPRHDTAVVPEPNHVIAAKNSPVMSLTI